MDEKTDKNNYKNFLFNLLGVFILILGITLILAWWESVVVLFKGALGIFCALCGLLILYVKNK